MLLKVSPLCVADSDCAKVVESHFLGAGLAGFARASAYTHPELSSVGAKIIGGYLDRQVNGQTDSRQVSDKYNTCVFVL